MIRDLGSDLRVLAAMARGGNRGGDAKDRLDAFYRPQAVDYDRFRERLLNGRAELIARLSPGPGEYWAEIGAGTARNLEYLGSRRASLARIDVVDLCKPLLAQAYRRCRDWQNVHVIRADARRYSPAAPLDGMWFSYSLSMMDHHEAVLENASRMLKPGGRIGVVDFFVSSRNPAPGRARHGPLTRHLWPRWFRHDGVRLSPELPDRLLELFPNARLDEQFASLPYLPAPKVPYFIFTATTRNPV